MPGRIETALTDREGVALVERIVSRDLGWIFREQRVVDQGVDGQVEVAVAGRGTGRLIAVQIKSGGSYFRRVKGGWAFYYSDRERELWLGHALPVMVVLVDLAGDTAYWQRISPGTERRTKTRYAVTVPEHQTLGAATEAWELAASGMEQRAAERFEANLEVLPPPVRRLIETEGARDPHSRLIALHLAEGRANPAGTAQALLTARPSWMQTSSCWSWRALGSFCAHHGAMRESADALEIAAESGGEARGGRLAAAALHVAGQDEDRARELVTAAREHGGAEVLVALVEAILQHPDRDASPVRTDGVLAAAGAELSKDSTAQSFLAEQALRAGDLASAARYAERVLTLDPESTEAMARVARIYARRSGTADALADDMARAVDLMSAAVEQRRQWGGSTLGLLTDLARALTLRGEHGATLRWLLPPPHGTASVDEANDPTLLRYALTAAHLQNSAELVTSVMAQMEGSLQDRVAQFRLGLLDLTESESESLWTEELARAEASQDWEAIAQAVHRLATLGVDVADHLLPLMCDGILPTGTDRLPRALVALRQRPEEGLALLRSLATVEVGAAEHLIETLVAMNRPDQAVEACKEAFDRFRGGRFLTRRALLLLQDGADERAEVALSEALLSEEGPVERIMLATHLAHLAGEAGHWSKAEAIMSTAMSYQDSPPDSAVWNLVRVQLASAGGVRAAATISRHRPQCRSEDEALLWAQAMVNVAWDDVLASEAIALASRFSHDPALATGLLTHLITATRGMPEAEEGETNGASTDADDEPEAPADNRPVVPGDLHRRAFDALDGLIKAHGSATGAQVIQSSSTEEMLEKLEEFARLTAPPDLTDVYDKIARGQLPAGMLAGVFRKTYTLALVRRAAGQLVAAAADDTEHQDEVDAATTARGRSVVVDLSTLLVLSRLSDTDTIAGQVPAMLLPRSARHDVLRAAVEVQTLGASPGTLGWDPRSERPVFHEQSSEEYRLVRERTEAMESMVRRTSVRDVAASLLLKDIPEVTQAQPWVAAIELAAHANAPLWCDDLAVRRLARSVDVATFSTLAMAEAVWTDRLQAAQADDEVDQVAEFAARVSAQLLAEYVVDVPVSTAQLIEQACSDNWAPAAAALAISRPAWWVWQGDAITELLKLFSVVGGQATAQLAGWQYAAMLGAARSRSTAEQARQLLAVLALLGREPDLQSEPAFEDLMEGCRTARRVADVLDDVGDPVLALPAARELLTQAGAIRSEQVVHALIAALGPSSPEA